MSFASRGAHREKKIGVVCFDVAAPMTHSALGLCVLFSSPSPFQHAKFRLLPKDSWCRPSPAVFLSAKKYWIFSRVSLSRLERTFSDCPLLMLPYELVGGLVPVVKIDFHPLPPFVATLRPRSHVLHLCGVVVGLLGGGPAERGAASGGGRSNQPLVSGRVDGPVVQEYG